MLLLVFPSSRSNNPSPAQLKVRMRAMQPAVILCVMVQPATLCPADAARVGYRGELCYFPSSLALTFRELLQNQLSPHLPSGELLL